jgi:hypothetical protein
MFAHSVLHRVRVTSVSAALLLVGGTLLSTTSTADAAARQVPIPAAQVVSSAGAASGLSVTDPNLPADDPAAGVVRKGLAVGRPDGPCDGVLEAVRANGTTSCTHGPDPAPKGVDVRKVRSGEELALATKQTSVLAATTGATVPCYGDGVTGNRVQAIYARASDKPDRFATIAPMIPQWAANADAVFNNSAAKTGGVRHVRWVTDASCNLDIARVTLSPNGDDSMSNTELELQSLGFDRGDRKYMIWMDANVYCGIADLRIDNQPGANNMNNWGSMWARVDNGCWGLYDSPEAHEIRHLMGGVQSNAPHSTGAGHCTDESDRMCYSDGPYAMMTYPCASSQELLFDCNNDDYFHTAPPAGSYLATYWNSAMNVFLETTGPAAPPPPSTTTTVPSSTTTSTWTGLLKGTTLSKIHTFGSGSGTAVATATYTGGGATVTMVIKTNAGTVIGSKSGASGVSLSVPVSSGNYSVTISGAKNTSYKVTVTRPPL